MTTILAKVIIFVICLGTIGFLYGDHVASAVATAGGILVGNLIYFRLLHKA